MAAILAQVRAQLAEEDAIGFRFKKKVSSIGRKPAKKLRKLLSKYNCSGGAGVQGGADATTPRARRAANDAKLQQGSDNAASRNVAAAEIEDITLTVDSLPASQSDERSSAADELLASGSSSGGATIVRATDEDAKAALLLDDAGLATIAGSLDVASADVTEAHVNKGGEEDDAAAVDDEEGGVVFKPTGGIGGNGPHQVEPTPRLIVGPRRLQQGAGAAGRGASSCGPDAPVFCPIDEEPAVPEPHIVGGAEVLTLHDVASATASSPMAPRPPAVFTMIPLAPVSTAADAAAAPTYPQQLQQQRPATPTSPYRLPVFAAPIQTRIPRTSSRPGTPTAAAAAAAAGGYGYNPHHSQLSSPCATAGSMTPPGSALSRIPSAPRDFILRPSSPAVPSYDLYSAMSDAAYSFAAMSIATTPLSDCLGGQPGSPFGGASTCAGVAGGSTAPVSPSAVSTITTQSGATWGGGPYSCWGGATSSLAVSRCSTPCSLSSSTMLVRGASGRFVIATSASRIPSCPPAFAPGAAPASPSNCAGASRIPACPPSPAAMAAMAVAAAAAPPTAAAAAAPPTAAAATPTSRRRVGSVGRTSSLPSSSRPATPLSPAPRRSSSTAAAAALTTSRPASALPRPTSRAGAAAPSYGGSSRPRTPASHPTSPPRSPAFGSSYTPPRMGGGSSRPATPSSRVGSRPATPSYRPASAGAAAAAATGGSRPATPPSFAARGAAAAAAANSRPGTPSYSANASVVPDQAQEEVVAQQEQQQQPCIEQQADVQQQQEAAFADAASDAFDSCDDEAIAVVALAADKAEQEMMVVRVRAGVTCTA